VLVGRAGQILLVRNLFHPLDRLAIQRFRDGDMRHGRRRRRAMPMLVARRTPDDIASAYFHDRTAVALRPTATSGDDEGLTKGMGVPGGAGARFEGDIRGRGARGRRRSIEGIDANRAGEVIGGTFLGWLRAGAFKFHGISWMRAARIGSTRVR